MDSQRAAALWQQLWQGLRGAEHAPTIHFLQTDSFPSAFAVSELAATSIGLASQALSDLLGRRPRSASTSAWPRAGFSTA
jgi:hypothetical protein